MTDDALRRPLPPRAPPRRRRHVDRPARLRHAPGALRRGQAARRAPRRRRRLRRSASAARRWPPRGSCTPTSCRSTTSAPTRRPRRQFIAMEYVEGQSGAELLREQGRLPADEVVELCAQACRGLDYAHRNGVVHRDIKPGNLLRNPEGIVKIADFGIAKAADDSDITRVGSVIGTAAYLAPEQARGEPAGPPSDLYALGVVAYQLVAGRLPYQGASLTDLARQQETGPADGRHTRSSPTCPPALSAAIMRALVADPDAPLRRGAGDGARAARGPARRRAARRPRTRRSRWRRTRRRPARCRPQPRTARRTSRSSRCSRSRRRRAAAGERASPRAPAPRAQAPQPRAALPAAASIVAALVVGVLYLDAVPAGRRRRRSTAASSRRSTTCATRSATTPK